MKMCNGASTFWWWNINKHVTPRRGTHKGEELVLLRPMRRLGRLLIATISAVSMVTMVFIYTVTSVGISEAALTMVDRHRIAWSVVAYQ